MAANGGIILYMEHKRSKTSPYKGEWRPFFRKLPWLLLIPVFYGLTWLAQKYPDMTEKLYSSSVYPYISRALGYASSLTKSVSIAECLVLALVIALLVLIAVHVIKLISGRLRFARFMSFIMGLCVFASFMFALFYIYWGFNYMRPSLYQRMDLSIEKRPVEELNALCIKLASSAGEARAQLKEDENGVFTFEAGYKKEFSKIPAAYRLLSADQPIFSGAVYPAKGVRLSEGMSYGGISGIYIPYTAEANVNIDQPPLLIAASAAHETAHYLGVAREDEANFVSYLACTYSLDASVRYSGTMLALINSANQLYKCDKQLYDTLVSEYYSEAMLRDIADYNKYWGAYEGPIEEAVDNMNDTYLKFNKQEDGVNSYGMMVDLLLAYYAS